jgi:hypothetical protein
MSWPGAILSWSVMGDEGFDDGGDLLLLAAWQA